MNFINKKKQFYNNMSYILNAVANPRMNTPQNIKNST